MAPQVINKSFPELTKGYTPNYSSMIFSATDIQQLVKTHYSLDVTVQILNGYDELNYLLIDEKGNKYILKIATDSHGYAFLEAQVNILIFLNKSESVTGFQHFLLNTEEKELTHLVIEGRNYYIRI
ncbi:MAG: hypothetical protein ABUL44_02595, partial [Flavobacterium sp.]